MSSESVPVTTSESLPELVRSTVGAHSADRGPLLPVLHDLHDRLGRLDDETIRLVAAELNLSRADVAGVVSFYSDFRREPGGAVTVRLCSAEACQSVGAERVVADVEQALGIKLGQTSADGAVTLEQVFCLGNCALGPAAQVAGRLHGRVDAESLLALLGREGS